jgi:hypothetical protein
MAKQQNCECASCQIMADSLAWSFKGSFCDNPPHPHDDPSACPRKRAVNPFYTLQIKTTPCPERSCLYYTDTVPLQDPYLLEFRLAESTRSIWLPCQSVEANILVSNCRFSGERSACTHSLVGEDSRSQTCRVLTCPPSALRSRLGLLTSRERVEDLDGSVRGQILVVVVTDLHHCKVSKKAYVSKVRRHHKDSCLLGALLQAPKHSTSISVNFPSGVVCPGLICKWF